jgi:hypothetical protein
MSRDPGAALVPISGSGRTSWLGNIVRVAGNSGKSRRDIPPTTSIRVVTQVMTQEAFEVAFPNAKKFTLDFLENSDRHLPHDADLMK